jgi:hypothetical protein
MSALQVWIFATKYLTSAIHSSLSETCFSTTCTMRVGWVVGISYVMGTTVVTVMEMATFPGWYSSDGTTDEFIAWFTGLAAKLSIAINTIWILQTIVSTIITIYAIGKIFAINRVLS